MSLGKRIAALRKEKGFTQEQLAEKVGVTRQAVSKWELEQSAPDFDCINRLSEIFDVTTDFLIKGEANVEDAVVVSKAEKQAEQNEKEDNAMSAMSEKSRVSGITIVGIIIVIFGVLYVAMSIIYDMNLIDSGDIPYIIMMLLFGISIILTGAELILIKKHPRLGLLCAVLSVVCMVLFVYVVPQIANAIEIERFENRPITVPSSLSVRRIYGFHFSICNIAYIVNSIIIMIQGLIICFKQNNLYNIVLSVADLLLMVLVVVFGEWYSVSELALPLIFFGVSVFMTVNYHLDEKLRKMA